MRHGVIIGHTPRKFSAIFSVFLRKGGIIDCKVTGRRQYSRDLPQGGMEIQCMYIFRGKEEDINKVKRCMSLVFPNGVHKNTTVIQLPTSDTCTGCTDSTELYKRKEKLPSTQKIS